MNYCEGLPPAFLVCEPAPFWAPLVRQRLDPAEVTVRELRSLVHTDEALAERPASVVGLQLTAENWPAAVAWVDRWRQLRPQACLVAFAQRTLSEPGWLLREAGCLDVIHSPGQLRRCLTLAQRHLRRFPPRPETPVQEALAALPWPARQPSEPPRAD